MRRFIILLIYSLITSALSQDGQVHFSLENQQHNNNQFTKDPLQLNKLKMAIKVDPFETWYFKDKFKSLQDILLTPQLLDNDAVERKTTKTRLQNAMARALLGQDISVAVMGGSISAGGGLINDYPDLRGIYYRVFIDWWEKAVQPFTDSKIGLCDLAIGGTSSNFYSFCYKALLKPGETMDIVFLEFSVNDFVIFEHSQLPMAFSLEQLTRRVLSEQNSPAVMYVNFIRGDQNIARCNSLENHGQTMLAWHYGITSLSMRSSLCPNPGNKKTPVMFSSDGNHASIIAHAQIAMMIINSARKSLLEIISSVQLNIYVKNPSHALPINVFYSTGTRKSVPSPLCYTLVTPDIHNMVLNPSLSVKEIENIGFKPFEKRAIDFHKTTQGQHISAPSRTDGFGGWQAERENYTLKLQLLLPEEEILGKNATRSVVIAFRTFGYGGKAEVWLDGYKPGVVINTKALVGHTRLVTVAEHVTAGSHVLSARTLNAGKFMLCGIMAGASSVPF